MNLRPIDFTAGTPSELTAALATAAVLAQQLIDACIEVHNAFDNGRRMVLVVSAPPAGVIGCAKRSYPNGTGGTTRIFAASHHGCQLEWMVHTSGGREVDRG